MSILFRGGKEHSQISQKLCSFYRGNIFIYKFRSTLQYYRSLPRNNPVSGALRTRELNSGVNVGLVRTRIRQYASPTRYHDAIRAIAIHCSLSNWVDEDKKYTAIFVFRF